MKVKNIYLVICSYILTYYGGKKNEKLEIGQKGGGLKGYIHLDICPGPGVEIVADMKDIPTKDEYWDKIFSTNTLEHAHWTEVKSCLKEWHRVLKTNGELEIVVPNIYGAMYKYVNGLQDISWETLMGYIFCNETYVECDDDPRRFQQLHKSGYSEKYLTEILEETGFSDIEFQGMHKGTGGDLWIKCKKVGK